MRHLIVDPDPCLARLADALDLERRMDAHQRANHRRGVAQARLGSRVWSAMKSLTDSPSVMQSPSSKPSAARAPGSTA